MDVKHALLLSIIVAAGPLIADDVLRPGTPMLDRPTLMTLGVKLPVTGDDNYNASVSVRYRQAAPKSGTMPYL